jgi:hypothetical protein
VAGDNPPDIDLQRGSMTFGIGINKNYAANLILCSKPGDPTGSALTTVTNWTGTPGPDLYFTVTFGGFNSTTGFDVLTLTEFYFHNAGTRFFNSAQGAIRDTLLDFTGRRNTS